MACESALFKIDSLTLDGDPFAIEDSTATIEGASGSENEVVNSGTGQDYVKRKRVARTIKCKLQFNGSYDPLKFASVCEAQIVMTDNHTGRRCRAGKCSFISMGAIGEGSVEITFASLTELQWL